MNGAMDVFKLLKEAECLQASSRASEVLNYTCQLNTIVLIHALNEVTSTGQARVHLNSVPVCL